MVALLKIYADADADEAKSVKAILVDKAETAVNRALREFRLISEDHAALKAEHQQEAASAAAASYIKGQAKGVVHELAEGLAGTAMGGDSESEEEEVDA